MIDRPLPRRLAILPKWRARLSVSWLNRASHTHIFASYSPPRPQQKSPPMPSLLDQSALSDLAERLVAAARRAGADAADAVAVRGVSLSVDVRDGAVEESQRAEGDDVGLRVLVGKKQAVVSTNDLNVDGFAG